MDILVRSNKIEITSSMKSYVNEKLGRIEKYFDDADNVKANVIVKVYDRMQKVEITIPLKNFVLRAEEMRDDFYAAIDIIIDKLERQIRKNKTKIQSKKNKEDKDFVLEYIESDPEPNDKTITKRKTIDVKPMHEEEAVLQMELLGHEFYLFKNAETLKPCLVYKRKAGDYGIIETE